MPSPARVDLLRSAGRDAFSADGSAFVGASAQSGGADGVDDAPPPTFHALLAVSPRFLARHARSADEATLLMDVSSAAAELDALVEGLADQLSDRARVLRSLHGGRRSQSGADAEAALLALQAQAGDVATSNAVRLLARFQQRFEALTDLRFLLAMEVEKHRTCLAAGRSALINNVEAATAREELLRLEEALVKRLDELARAKALPPAFEPLATRGGCGEDHEVCWSALSAPGSDESKRSDGNPPLSAAFASLPSPSTALSTIDVSFSD